MSAWFKCFPRRIMNSYSALDSDQKACAYTLTMLIYDHDAPLRLPESMLAGACGFNVRKFKRVLAELVALGKFYIAPSGAIGNELADELLDHRRSSKETGRAGGKKRAANAAAKAKELAIASQSTDNQLSKVSEDINENKATVQGSLELAFNHKDKDSSVSKDTEGPSARDVIYTTGRTIMGRQGVTPKAAGVVLGRLVKVKGEAEAERIVMQIGAAPKLDVHDYLWGIINGKPVRQLTTSNVMPVSLCDGHWMYDVDSQELFRLVDDRRVPRPGGITDQDRSAIDMILRFSDARAA